VKVLAWGSPPGQHGVTLIEIMVALAIASVLVAAAGTLFVNSRKNLDSQLHQQHIQESARHALELIGRDLRRAGYYGGLPGSTAIAGTSPPLEADGSCPLSTAWGRMLARPLFGLNDSNSGYACIADSDYLRGDIVVTRYAHPVAVGAKLSDRQLYLRSNPSAGALFAGADSDSNLLSAPAEVRRIVSHAYHVGPSAQTCADGSRPPALWRERLASNGRPAGEELVTGVEQLQIQYGLADFDADGDAGSDDATLGYVDADMLSAAQWNAPFTSAAQWRDWRGLATASAASSAVVLVKIWLLVRSPCAEAAVSNKHTYVMGSTRYSVDDHFQRQLYTTTVHLRN
jgi:type IV pilus assembly protein PilW